MLFILVTVFYADSLYESIRRIFVEDYIFSQNVCTLFLVQRYNVLNPYLWLHILGCDGQVLGLDILCP